MTGRGRINVHTINGAVVITCGPADARDLAAALGEKFVLDESTRPTWTDDIVSLHRGAATAEVQAGNVPAPVMVPVLTSRHLVAITGGEPA